MQLESTQVGGHSLVADIALHVFLLQNYSSSFKIEKNEVSNSAYYIGNSNGKTSASQSLLMPARPICMLVGSSYLLQMSFLDFQTNVIPLTFALLMTLVSSILAMLAARQFFL